MELEPIITILAIFVGFWALTLPAKTDHSLLIALAALSITWLGVFLAFDKYLLEKELKEKQESSFKKKWKQYKGTLQQLIKLLSAEFSKDNKSKIDFDLIQEKAQEMGDLASELQKQKQKITRTIRMGQNFLVITLIMALIQVMVPNQINFGGTVTATNLVFVSLIGALCSFILLIRYWNELKKE